MAVFNGPLQNLIDEMGRLPGIGPKSAQRITFHLLKVAPEDALRLAEAIIAVKERITLCTRCFNVAEGGECAICLDDRRDATVVCVVEDPRDIVSVEKTGEFSGRYHVLQGSLNPIEGIGPEQLRVRELLGRLDEEGITEVILCTNPNLEGEATAMYLARLLKPMGLTVTRIASGLPVGGDLEYADELTLGPGARGPSRGRRLTAPDPATGATRPGSWATMGGWTTTGQAAHPTALDPPPRQGGRRATGRRT